MVISNLNPPTKRVHRKPSSLTKLKRNSGGDDDLMSSFKGIYQSHQQQQKVLIALRRASLNATLLTVKLTIQANRSNADSEYAAVDPEVPKVLNNITDALEIVRNSGDNGSQVSKVRSRLLE